MSALNKEQEKEIKRLRKEIEIEYKPIKRGGLPPAILIQSLEKIIENYTKIYKIQKPELKDKVMFATLKGQYKVVCAMTRIKPKKFYEEEKELKLSKVE